MSASSRSFPRRLKRGADMALAGVGLIVVAPIATAVAIAVWLDVGRPLIFTQERTGQGGRLFRLRKFRTMRDTHDRDGRPLSDAERLTATGRALRASSLDELPQLWNVLVGDMSLVGPRPLLPEYLPRYSVAQARRHEVPAGITGWAQINGRNEVTWERRFELDVWYVDHWSLALDARILVATVARVLGRSGISAAGEATMKPFQGTP